MDFQIAFIFMLIFVAVDKTIKSCTVSIYVIEWLHDIFFHEDNMRFNFSDTLPKWFREIPLYVFVWIFEEVITINDISLKIQILFSFFFFMLGSSTNLPREIVNLFFKHIQQVETIVEDVSLHKLQI